MIYLLSDSSISADQLLLCKTSSAMNFAPNLESFQAHT